MLKFNRCSYLAVACILMIVCNLNAQELVSIRGIVIDSATNRPLVGASLEILPIKKGSITHKNGVFSLEGIPIGEYTLIAKFAGYEILSRQIKLPPDTIIKIMLEPSSILLKQTVVESNRESGFGAATKQTVTITTAELDEHRGQTLGDALKTINGVTTLQTGPSISKPVIHGLHSQRVTVMNAGVAQEGQQWGAEHAPEIDPFSISGIEVLKGAAGVEYGVGAIGCVIRVEQRALPVNKGIGGEFTANAFSNNRQGAGSLLLEGGAFDRVGWRAQISGRKAGNSKTSDYWMANTGFEELNGSAAVGYSTENFTANAYYSHFGTTLGIYLGSHFGNQDDLLRAIAAGNPLTPSEFTYIIVGPKQEIAHDLWSLHSTYRVESLGQFEIQGGYQLNSRKEFDARRRYSDSTSNITTPSFALNLESGSFEIKLHHNPIGLLNGTVGISSVSQVNVGKSLSYLIPNFSVSGIGAFAVETYTTGDVILSSGLRFDIRSQKTYQYLQKTVPDSTVTYSGISGSIGALWQISKQESFSSNISTAFRAPSVNELYSEGVHHGTAQYEIGDRTLKPERGFSWDANLKVNSYNTSSEIGVYAHYFDGYIYTEPSLTSILTLRGAFPVFQYRQASALITGIDANTLLFFTDYYRADISVSWLYGQNLDTNEPLFQMPAPRGKITNHFHISDIGSFFHNYLELGGQFVARQTRFPLNGDYVDPPAGYVLFDIAAGTEIPISESHRMHLNIGVQNLLNKDYRDYLSRFRYFIADTGINFILRLRIPFGEYPDE
ncbi:MAG: TonB-dependent receptor [Ignavibacteriae bacterium]|nr:TonB-dependent receptor [Ignavibacteriota bacterium]